MIRGRPVNWPTPSPLTVFIFVFPFSIYDQAFSFGSLEVRVRSAVVPFEKSARCPIIASRASEGACNYSDATRVSLLGNLWRV
jgi:hypothetical protein